MDDDWMHPNAVGVTIYSQADAEKRRREAPYLIQRCRRVTCFGNPGFIEEWSTWSSHATKDERDEALSKLKREHSWTLRPASYSYGVLRIDDDDDDILARAEAIKMIRAAKPAT